MQCSVTVVVELAPEAGIAEMEQAVLEAGRQAMRDALKQAVRGYEEAHAACPHCGRARSQSQGTVARRVLATFGRVVVRQRRQRCLACGRRFRPARACLAVLGGAGDARLGGGVRAGGGELAVCDRRAGAVRPLWGAGQP